MSRAIVIQLARLGDLVQTLPVLTSLHSVHFHRPLDFLCPAPLASLGELFPFVDRVYPWSGEQWHELATRNKVNEPQRLDEAVRILFGYPTRNYEMAYNLNNHPRGILAAHLLSEEVIGPGEYGPLSRMLPAWADYLRHIAPTRGENRVHLSDAFCGLCRVPPPSHLPILKAPLAHFSCDWKHIFDRLAFISIGIVLGAGDPDRRVPLSVWRDLIIACAEQIPQSYLWIIGGEGEREAALSLEQYLPIQYANRVVNVCGRTSLPQLVAILNRCRWVVGSDTGPLHLGTMCGARVIGWYFSRARVHETGPYGSGHYVWQHTGDVIQNPLDAPEKVRRRSSFQHWPVMETIQLMQEGHGHPAHHEWELWTSQRDEWGAYYTRKPHADDTAIERKETWAALSQWATGIDRPHPNLKKNFSMLETAVESAD